MNSQEALKFVEAMAAEGRVRRISSEGRETKAIIFQTLSGRNFSVEMNDVKSRGYATQTKIVCERAPKEAELPWDEVASRMPIKLTERQFASSAYKLKGARLEPGRQMSVYVEDVASLEKFLEWFDGAGLPHQTEGNFSRIAIEAAMDAFDRYRKRGENEDIFGHFGDPLDYWVRSTRARDNRVYPTKPLVGFILKKTELNGGWGQKADAAARLHNVGFIIVDQDDKPVPPLEHYDHLTRDADRIRLCALNYFIEPAREKDAFDVSIRAGDLAAAMGLKDAFPNICQALNGEKFQNLARVPTPKHTEPIPSSSTIFTYQLGAQSKANTMTENLILYGPPGTGKTYTTAREAVRLCLGGEAAAALEDDRDALVAAYRRLVSEGRIEFLTFHQSLSYEEFVEGLRPSTGADDIEGPDETDGGTGFRLKCHEGIFKRISERARLDQGDSGGSQRLDRSARVFNSPLKKSPFTGLHPT